MALDTPEVEKDKSLINKHWRCIKVEAKKLKKPYMTTLF